MNYYKRHLGDYAKDAGWLTTYQHGVYVLLLDWYYANEKPIPVDLAYRIVRARSGPERKAVDEVLLAFFDLNKEAGFAHNKRADIDLNKYRTKSEVNSMIAKERESTKRARNVADSCASGEPSHKPLTTSQKSKIKSPPEAAIDPKADLFARWKSLPGSGGGAFLVKLLRDHKPEQRVLDAIEVTLAETRADPKAYIIGVLAKKPPSDPQEAAALEAQRVSAKWAADPDSAPWAGAL